MQDDPFTSYIVKWQRENTLQIGLRFTNNSGVPEAFQKMQETTGMKPTEYVRKVVLESLEFDGYLEPVHPLDRKRKK